MIQDVSFENEQMETVFVGKETYESCVFKSCNFQNTSLAFCKFIDCKFYSCQMSNISLNQTSFQDCSFSDCQMKGLNFESINPFLFKINCSKCDLELSIFMENDLSKSSFEDCKFLEAQIVDCECSNTFFQGSNFKDALFDNCKLNGADFLNTENIIIDPAQNSIQKLKINQENLASLLLSYNLDIRF